MSDDSIESAGDPVSCRSVAGEDDGAAGALGLPSSCSRDAGHRHADHLHADHDHGQCGHGHGLTQADHLVGVSDSRLLWCVVMNQLLTVGQVAAGLISGSVALLSDAAHNFSDANSLLIAYIARRISHRQADSQYTFGYRRAELIGATINLTLLAAVGVYLIYEAVMRFLYPSEIVGWLMAAAALLAIIVDVGTAALLWSMGQGSLNVRAAFIHNLTDALGSLAVLIGAGLVMWQGWTWVDPLLTLLIAGYVLWQVATLLPQATQILMEGAPSSFDMAALVAQTQSLDGVRGLHHVHLWQLDEQHLALEAHVVVDADDVGDFETIKQRIKQLLQDDFDVHHSTLEFEFNEGCADHHNDSFISANCGLPSVAPR